MNRPGPLHGRSGPAFSASDASDATSIAAETDLRNLLFLAKQKRITRQAMATLARHSIGARLARAHLESGQAGRN